MIRHAIVDTSTGIVVNVIEYETTIEGLPPGMAEPMIAVASDVGQIGWTFKDGVFANPVAQPVPTPDWSWGQKFVDIIGRGTQDRVG